MTSMLDYDTRRDMITTHAWETWTKNGLGLDGDMRKETEKIVQDAVNRCAAGIRVLIASSVITFDSAVDFTTRLAVKWSPHANAPQ